MDAPTGTVTLVFTDIEGSTSLWEKYRDAFKPVLEEHNRIMRQAAEAFRGYEVKTEGDAFFVAFARPADALEFALRAQTELAHVKAGADAVKVRIGIHTGEPLVEIDRHGRADYFGPAVNKAARVASAGHGGQTLLTQAAWHAAGVRDESLPVTSLGEVRLRGIEEPERLFQVTPRDLAPAQFPPLRGVAENPTNLPSQTTSFVGRGRELRALRTLLLGTQRRTTDSVKPLDTLAREPGVPDTGVIVRATLERDRGARLITLTGPGGCGKTRLAVALGSDVLSSFRDGVWFVDLADAADEAGITTAVAAALRLDLPPGRGGPGQRLAWAMEGREMLLVLDTFEHLRGQAALLQQWLRTAPRLKLLITSRELLRLDGELEFAVTPLPLPAMDDVQSGTARLPARVSDSPAVQLFLERAAQARPGFALTHRNAAAIAEVVNRVDGIPLAIELAAARLRGLTPEQLAERLRGGIELLSSRDKGGGRRSSLTDAIAWSYGLLDAWERTALLQLSIFEGPFSLESAEAVLLMEHPLDATAEGADDPPPETMDLVFSLRDKSLLSLKSDDDRYLMDLLGTIRAWLVPVLGRVAGDDFMARLRLRHAQHFAQRAGALAALLESPMGHSLREADTWGIADTQGAALWALANDQLLLGLRLAQAACRIFHSRHRYQDMHRMAQAAMDRVNQLGGADALRSKPEVWSLLPALMTNLATATQRLFQLDKAIELGRQAQELAHLAGDRRSEAEALNIQGISCFYTRDFDQARKCFDTSLAIHRAQKDERGIANSLANVAMAQIHGDFEEMRRLAQEAYSIYARLGDKRGQARAANTLGVAFEWMRDYDRARELYEDSIRLKLQIKDEAGAANSRGNLASMAYRGLRFEKALEQFEQIIEPLRRGGDKNNFAMALESMATIHVGMGRPEAALELLDRCIAIRREINDRGGLMDAQSIRAAALAACGRTLEAEAQCDELLALAQELARPNDELLARLRCALCSPRQDRPAHLARATELAAMPELINEDKEVLVGLVNAEHMPDQAAANQLRKTLLARTRFTTKLMDVIFRAQLQCLAAV